MTGLKTEIEVRVPHSVGVMARVLTPLKEAGVNILAYMAYGEYAHGKIVMVTQNNDLAKRELKKVGLTPLENEIVFVELPDRSGGLAEAATFLAEAGINIKTSYGTMGRHGAYNVVFDTNDNKKAVAILSRHYG